MPEGNRRRLRPCCSAEQVPFPELRRPKPLPSHHSRTSGRSRGRRGARSASPRITGLCLPSPLSTFLRRSPQRSPGSGSRTPRARSLAAASSGSRCPSILPKTSIRRRETEHAKQRDVIVVDVHGGGLLVVGDAQHLAPMPIEGRARCSSGTCSLRMSKTFTPQAPKATQGGRLMQRNFRLGLRRSCSQLWRRAACREPLRHRLRPGRRPRLSTQDRLGIILVARTFLISFASSGAVAGPPSLPLWLSRHLKMYAHARARLSDARSGVIPESGVSMICRSPVSVPVQVGSDAARATPEHPAPDKPSPADLEGRKLRRSGEVHSPESCQAGAKPELRQP